MTSRETEYLECERHWVFWLLMFVAGFYGVYTFLLREKHSPSFVYSTAEQQKPLNDIPKRKNTAF